MFVLFSKKEGKEDEHIHFSIPKLSYQISPSTSPRKIGGRDHRGKFFFLFFCFCTSEVPSTCKGTISRRNKKIVWLLHATELALTPGDSKNE